MQILRLYANKRLQLNKIMCRKSFKKRRQILDKIPTGIYCYSHRRFEGRCQIIETCPYWKSIGEYRAKCTLYNVKDDFSQDPFTLLWDKCKICNLKYGT